MQPRKRPLLRPAALLLLVSAVLSLTVIVAYRSYVAPSDRLLAGREFAKDADPRQTEVVLTEGEMPALLGQKGGAWATSVGSESQRALLLAVVRDALDNSPRYGSKSYALHRIDAKTVSGGVSILVAGDGYAFSLVDEPDVWYGEAMFLRVVYGCILMLNCQDCEVTYLGTRDSMSLLEYQTNWKGRLRNELEVLAQLVVEIEKQPDRQLKEFWEVTGLDRKRFLSR